MIKPLLTISIPTYNRAAYLNILLQQLHVEILKLNEFDNVEIVVSDNASEDSTQDLVFALMKSGICLRYLRNSENIGSDRNIAQAFNEARGRYVIIMGDDDVLVNGALNKLLNVLSDGSPSVVLLRAYGYDYDFRREFPKGKFGFTHFSDISKFLLKAGPQITLISSCVIHKEILEPIDAISYIGDHLVQVHLVLQALLVCPTTAVSNDYLVACKRNNSGGYLYAEIFVKNLGQILDHYSNLGLSRYGISIFEGHLLKTHHPYYVWRGLGMIANTKVISKSYFENRYKGRVDYSIFVAPLFYLPKPLAWIWGVFVILVGRLLFGDDFIRGLYFCKNKLLRAWVFCRSFFNIMGNNPPR